MRPGAVGSEGPVTRRAAISPEIIALCADRGGRRIRGTIPEPVWQSSRMRRCRRTDARTTWFPRKAARAVALARGMARIRDKMGHCGLEVGNGDVPRESALVFRRLV